MWLLVLMQFSLDHLAHSTQGVATCVVGRHHTCAILNDNSLKCFGRNQNGQLGLASTVASLGELDGEMGENLPTVDLGSGMTVKAATAGEWHTCAVLNDDSLKCFGDGDFGQVSGTNYGQTANEMGENLPHVDLGSGRTVKQVDSGGYHVCSILNDNSLTCFWENGDGRLGLGHTSKVGDDASHMGESLPIVDLGVGRTVKQIASGFLHTCAVLDDRSLKCFGNGLNGKIATVGNVNRGDLPSQMGDHLPSVDLGEGRTVKQCASGGHHNCAILDDDSLKCFGLNDYGQLGLESNSPVGGMNNDMGDNLPCVNLGVGRTVKQVSAGVHHTCAILDDDSLKCFGRGDLGQLGGESSTNQGIAPGEMGENLPAVDLGVGRTVKQVSPGMRNRHTCVILDDDSLKCFGNDGFGQLGLESSCIGGDNCGNNVNEMGDNLPTVHLFDAPSTTTRDVFTSTSVNETAQEVLEFLVTLDVNNSEEFLNEEGIEIVLKQAMAELVGVDVAWIENFRVSSIRRLATLSAFIDASPSVVNGRELNSKFDLTTNGGIKVEFDVAVPPEGGPGKVTATLLLEEFDAKSLKEATEVVDRVVKSGALGSKGYDVAVVAKKVSRKGDSSITTTATSSETESAVVVFVVLVSGASVCIIFALSLAVWYYKKVQKGLREKRHLLAIDSSPCFSEAELLHPNHPITLDCKRKLLNFLADMLDYSNPIAFVCYAVGQREEDAELSGLFYLGAVVQALRNHGIGCYAILPSTETNASLDITSFKYKLFLMLETRHVYDCRRCMEEIYIAQTTRIEIMRLQFEANLPRENAQWRNLRYDDLKALRMRETVRHNLASQRILPDAPELVQSVPDFLETFSLDLGRRFKSLESLSFFAKGGGELQINSRHGSSNLGTASKSNDLGNIGNYASLLDWSAQVSSDACANLSHDAVVKSQPLGLVLSRPNEIGLGGQDLACEAPPKSLAKGLPYRRYRSDGSTGKRGKEKKGQTNIPADIESGRCGVGRALSEGGSSKKKRGKGSQGSQKKEKSTSAPSGVDSDIVKGISRGRQKR